MKRFTILSLLIILLTSCSSPLFAESTSTPTPTATREPTATATYTPLPTATPTQYPTIDPSTLPPILQDFLNRYSTFEEMNEGIKNDYHWVYEEVNGLPEGSFNGSALIALENAQGSCSETAIVSALFGEKFGYHPYILILIDASTIGHAIYVFQNPITGKWGYNDNFVDFQQPSFSTIGELANDYIRTHPYAGEYYDYWYLADLEKTIVLYGRDWRTTTHDVPITSDINVQKGTYTP